MIICNIFSIVVKVRSFLINIYLFWEFLCVFGYSDFCLIIDIFFFICNVGVVEENVV